MITYIVDIVSATILQVLEPFWKNEYVRELIQYVFTSLRIFESSSMLYFFNNGVSSIVWHYIEDDDIEEVYKITFGVDNPFMLIATAVTYVADKISNLVSLVFIESLIYSFMYVYMILTKFFHCQNDQMIWNVIA